MTNGLEKFRQHLAASPAVLAMTALGFICGSVAALLIIAFRFAIDSGQRSFMPFGDLERFEALDPSWRILLPVAGAALVGALFHFFSPAERRVGIVHVLERLQYHEGHLPIRNFVLQFVGGVIALISGQSIGREAPSVHLGAAASSLLGQRLQLPNNATRIMVASGTAAAIAASFNTPLAGVVFAMEVVMMEYTIIGFTPVIVSSVAATVITRAIYDDGAVFFLPHLGLGSLWELSYILLMGITLGALSAFFVAMVRFFARVSESVPVFLRFSLCGLFVGVIASQLPEVLGLGYDTVNAAVLGDIAVKTLALLMLAKIVASAACVGVGLPGGLIGPAIVIGSMVGGLFAYASSFIPGFTSGYGLYVMLGMGAMMSATLHAPLAALITLLELTGNPNLILPAMLAIISANITAREFFNQESIFTLLLRDAGLDYRHDPVSQSLRHIAVAGVMNRSFVELDQEIALKEIRAALKHTPQWVIIRTKEDKRLLLPAADLVRASELAVGCGVDDEVLAETTLNLAEIPGQRLTLAGVHLQATMHEARDTLKRQGAEALYVRRPIAPMTDRTFGVILQADIEGSYTLRGFR
ncbi:MAG: chloride channel protein [Gammaproteobacteria bacterium]